MIHEISEVAFVVRVTKSHKVRLDYGRRKGVTGYLGQKAMGIRGTRRQSF